MLNGIHKVALWQIILNQQVKQSVYLVVAKWLLCNILLVAMWLPRGIL
ncbi:hypothetical protein C7M51_04396 (plasmid) [Mixta intestinalis]|uniref:Uncharacterized protein n=1 Tax=Mixta intestinalis TaxID=1615494 RepID=A0A6P1Q8D5_9GAMM|nr:hypothetical protein C7M51_04396 [Mixta intestinalis]